MTMMTRAGWRRGAIFLTAGTVAFGIAAGVYAAIPVSSAAIKSAGDFPLTVKIVVRDDDTFNAIETVKVGQVLKIGVDTSGDVMQEIDFGTSGQVCISGSPNTCHAVSDIETYEGSGRVHWWRVQVLPSMVVNKQFTVDVTFNNQTLTGRSFPVVSPALVGPPKVSWTDIGTTGEVEITFPNVSKQTPFAATLRVENSWSDSPEPVTGTKSSPKFVHKITRSHGFSLRPLKGFSTPQYKDVVNYGLSFDPEATLDVRLQNPFRGSGKAAHRTGTLRLAVIHNGRKVGAQAYFYTITQTTGHDAKENTDEFFNYCLKEHPETIFKSGGVLICHVPGGTEMNVGLLSYLAK